jgi:hypothetical protein
MTQCPRLQARGDSVAAGASCGYKIHRNLWDSHAHQVSANFALALSNLSNPRVRFHHPFKQEE